MSNMAPTSELWYPGLSSKLMAQFMTPAHEFRSLHILATTIAVLVKKLIKFVRQRQRNKGLCNVWRQRGP